MCPHKGRKMRLLDLRESPTSPYLREEISNREVRDQRNSRKSPNCIKMLQMFLFVSL